MTSRDQRKEVSTGRAGGRRWWPVLVLVAVVAIVATLALDRDDADTPESTPSPAVTPPPDAPLVSIAVRGKQGVEGTVTLHGLGGQTLVVLDLDGDSAPGAARLRDGTCGGVSDQDEWLLMGVDEAGSSSTVVDVPLGTLLRVSYVVDLPRAELPPVAEVCAAIVGTPVNAAGTPVDLGDGDIGGTRGTSGDGTGGSILSTGGATPGPIGTPVPTALPDQTPQATAEA